MKLNLGIKRLKNTVREPLYKNSLFLIFTSGLASLGGYVFWLLVARFYDANEVGQATALVSALGLVSAFSKFGLDSTLTRYLPRAEDQAGVINSCLTIGGLSPLLLAVLFIAGLSFWSPALLFIQKDITLLLLFIISAPLYSISNLLGNAFVGIRSAKFSFITGLISGLAKIPLLFAFVSLGSRGILISWSLALLGAVVAAFVLLPRLVSKYRPLPTFKKQVINEIRHYSLGIYIAGIFDSLPGLLLPLLVINLLGEEMSAYFFMAWALAGFLSSISAATTASLLAEGSYEPSKLRGNVIRTIKFTFAILIPAIVVVFVLGDRLLLLFGREYSENGLDLVKILALTNILGVVVLVYETIMKVQLGVRPIVAIRVFIAIGTIAGSYILIPRLGLLGIGIACISTYGIMALILGWLIIQKIIRRRV